MFFEYFENLRSEPKEVRQRFALIFASVFTGVVIIIWLITIFLSSFGARGTKPEKEVKKEPATIETMFEDSNSFLDDSQGAGELLEEDWTKELEALDGNSQKIENATATVPNLPTSTQSTLQDKTTSTNQSILPQ